MLHDFCGMLRGVLLNCHQEPEVPFIAMTDVEKNGSALLRFCVDP
jgi:hypothetical protein